MKMKMKMKLSSSTKTSVCLLACTAAAAGFVQLQPQFGAAATKKLFLASMADSKQLPANVLQVADGELRSELASGFGSIGTEFQSLAASIGVPGTLPPPPVVAPLPPLPSGPFSSVSDASLAGGCLPQLRAEPGPNTNNFFVRNFDIAKYGGFEGQRRNHNKGYNQIEGYWVNVIRNGATVFQGDSWFKDKGYSGRGYWYGVVFDGPTEFQNWQDGDIIELAKFHGVSLTPQSAWCTSPDVINCIDEPLHPDRCIDWNYITFRKELHGTEPRCEDWCKNSGSWTWAVANAADLPAHVSSYTVKETGNSYDVTPVNGDGWKCNFADCTSCSQCRMDSVNGKRLLNSLYPSPSR